MADFLHRMAQLTTGSTPTVKPLRSPFMSDGITSGFSGPEPQVDRTGPDTKADQHHLPDPAPRPVGSVNPAHTRPPEPERTIAPHPVEPPPALSPAEPSKARLDLTRLTETAPGLESGPDSKAQRVDNISEIGPREVSSVKDKPLITETLLPVSETDRPLIASSDRMLSPATEEVLPSAESDRLVQGPVTSDSHEGPKDSSVKSSFLPDQELVPQGKQPRTIRSVSDRPPTNLIKSAAPRSGAEGRDSIVRPPSVEINIGRIEITAEQADTFAPAVKDPVEPVMNLKQYLTNRNEGKR